MAACLAAASGVAYWATRDSARLLHVPTLVLFACTYIVVAALAAAVVFFLMPGHTRPCFRHSFFSCVGAAALLPGTALLVQRHSVFAIVPTAAIVWLAASALRTHDGDRVVATGRMSPLAPVTGGLVQLTLGMIAAHEITLAVLAAGVGTWTLAAIPGAVPLFRRTRRCDDLRGTERKWLLVFANAFTLTCFALLPHVWWGNRIPVLEIPQSAAAAEEYRERSVPPDAPPDDDVHQGIVIYPEEERHTVLVPPMPAVRTMGTGRANTTLSIPFFGVYWLYRPPYRRPPPRSLVLRADPSKRNLHSNDGRSLNMEARQNFGTYFDPACCASVTVVAVNHDPQPDSVGVELLVRDSAQDKAAPRFVGRVQLPQEVDASMRFDFPDGLPRFDEVVLSFKLAVWRRDRAPKVSISRFVFAPR